MAIGYLECIEILRGAFPKKYDPPKLFEQPSPTKVIMF